MSEPKAYWPKVSIMLHDYLSGLGSMMLNHYRGCENMMRSHTATWRRRLVCLLPNRRRERSLTATLRIRGSAFCYGVSGNLACGPCSKK